MRVLVAGYGYLGAALGQRLAKRGFGVYALRRRVGSPQQGVTPVIADLSEPGSLASLPDRVDAVVYSAAADRRGESDYRSAYVAGVANLCAALRTRARPPRRFVFVSSTAVYGQSDGEWVDEHSETNPPDYRGRTLLEGEGLSGEGPWQATRLRLGGIYGPERIGLVRRVASGTWTIPEDGPRYTNRIHRDDAAGMLEHLIDRETVAPVYLGVDDEPADLAEVAGFIAARLGVALRQGPAESPPTRPLGHKRVSNRLIRRSGFELAFPTYREGYGPLIDDFLARSAG